MREEIRPYDPQQGSKKVQVKKMFDTIAGNYDTLNRVISFGIDQRWRKSCGFCGRKAP